MREWANILLVLCYFCPFYNNNFIYGDMGIYLLL